MDQIRIQPVYRDKACRKIIYLLLQQQTKTYFSVVYYTRIFLEILLFLLCIHFLIAAGREILFQISLKRFLTISFFRLFFLFTLLFGVLLLLWYLMHIYDCDKYGKYLQRLHRDVSSFYILDSSGLLVFTQPEGLEKGRTVFYQYGDCRKVWIKKYGILLLFQPPSGAAVFFALPSVWFSREEYQCLTIWMSAVKEKEEFEN